LLCTLPSLPTRLCAYFYINNSKSSEKLKEYGFFISDALNKNKSSLELRKAEVIRRLKNKLYDKSRTEEEKL